MGRAHNSLALVRGIPSRLFKSLVTYEGEVGKAVEAYNNYVHLRHQADANLKRRGLAREDVSREVFRKIYGPEPSARGEVGDVP